jgi:hypothetical protein
VQFLPDVTAEWLINPSGTIRTSFFYRENIDYLATNTTGAARTKRSGANISYRKEFDSIKALFNGPKKRLVQPAVALIQPTRSIPPTPLNKLIRPP